MNTRLNALKELLEPITWSLSSSIPSRQNIVYSRVSQVNLVYPFLTNEEKVLADEWFKNEEHSGLWEK